MSTSKNNEQKERETKTRPWTDEDKKLLIELYPTHSNKELCEILEKTDGQLRGMKSSLGLNTKFKPFTDTEKRQIEDFYKNNSDVMDLETFANKIGREKTSISRYARRLGLTKCDRHLSLKSKEKLKQSLDEYRKTDEYLNIVKKQQKQLLSYYAHNKHPRGMLGKHHSKDTCRRLSESHFELFANMSPEERHQRAIKAVETKRKNGGFSTTSNSYSRCKGGTREDLKQYFRSAWEANIARVLNYLHIEWEYEYKRFNFENEAEGILSYQPDFYLPTINKWIEVKGWMDDISKKRLELFKKYYPKENENLYLIDEIIYKDIEKKYSSLIENWEYKNHYKNHVDKDNPRTEIEILINENKGEKGI